MNAAAGTRCGQGSGRPKDMEKRAAILDAAASLFMQGSYAGTSMDAIAAAAGVCKLTVYSHFGGKDKLFWEVVRHCIDEVTPAQIYEYSTAEDIGSLLLRLARRLIHQDTDPRLVKALRIILGDCRQGYPRFGQLLWEEYGLRMHDLMAQLLLHAQADGKLDLHDMPAELVAIQFFALIKGDSVVQYLCGCIDGSEDETRQSLELHAKAGVSTFLRAFAVA